MRKPKPSKVQKHRRPAINPLRIDPSRTGKLRREFETDLAKRFTELRRRLRKLIVDDDAFGLKDGPKGLPPVANRREFVSVQAMVTEPDIVTALKQIQAGIAPEDLKKLESDYHVTVRYGLHSVDKARVQELLFQHSPLTAWFGNLSVFRNADFDVLKFDVNSPMLQTFNSDLAEFPHTDTHPEYEPHLTLAYLKPGTGWKYVYSSGLHHKPLPFTSLEVAHPNNVRSVIQLSLTNNARFNFLTTVEKLNGFRSWLGMQLSDLFMTHVSQVIADTFWHRYIRDGYEQGAGRAFDDTEVQARAMFAANPLKGFAGTREDFLRASFAHPISIDRLKTLASRVFTELQGVTSTMDTLLTRTLTDGLTQGKSPHVVARDIMKSVNGIEEKRAKVIARTEIMRSHAEGQLDTFERLGVDKIGAMVEWSTTGDAKVCPLCRPLDGIVLKVTEARGMLPRHPGCRCSWVPSGVGESPTRETALGETVRQQREKKMIDRALDESIKAEAPKRPLKEQRKRSRWIGADADISKTRPKSILDGQIANAYNPNQPRDSNGRWGTGSGVFGAERDSNLRKWFGSSQVVDASGSPKVMYRGAVEEEKTVGELTWYSESAEQASGYAQLRSVSQGVVDSGNVTPVYLKVERPYDVLAKHKSLDEFLTDAENRAPKPNYEKSDAIYEKIIGASENPTKSTEVWRHWNETTQESRKLLADYLDVLGYDGIKFTEDGIATYAVFRQSQVKSALGNIGSFDPLSAVITNAMLPDDHLRLTANSGWYRRRHKDQE